MCEIEPARFEPWGYVPAEIAELVGGWGYDRYALGPDATLIPTPGGHAWSGNYVALPR